MSTTETETVFSLEADRLETNLRDQRQQLRRTPGDRILELAIADGDERRRQLLRDHAVHVRVEQERAAADAARAQAARTELEQRLMDEYIASAPGTTAAEAQVALPDLLRRHRIAELDRRDAALVEAKRRIGKF
jgi:multidrug resistance efflux pump